MNANATLTSLIRHNHKNGVITVDQFARAAGISKLEAAEVLRTARGGWFVIGRKGHKSRFLFGEAFDNFKHSEELRSEWRKRNGYVPNVIPTLKGQGGRNRQSTYNTTPTRSVGRPRKEQHPDRRIINVHAGARLQMGRKNIAIPPRTRLELVEA